MGIVVIIIYEIPTFGNSREILFGMYGFVIPGNTELRRCLTMSENKHDRPAGGRGYYIGLLLCAAAIVITGFAYNAGREEPAKLIAIPTITSASIKTLTLSSSRFLRPSASCRVCCTMSKVRS